MCKYIILYLKTEKEDIENEKKLIIAADKTSNHYRVEPEKKM